jgi:hypothetical protein
MKLVNPRKKNLGVFSEKETNTLREYLLQHPGHMFAQELSDILFKHKFSPRQVEGKALSLGLLNSLKHDFKFFIAVDVVTRESFTHNCKNEMLNFIKSRVEEGGEDCKHNFYYYECTPLYIAN